METQTAVIAPLEKKVSSLQVQIAEVRITSQPTYDRTVALLATVKDMQNDPDLIKLEEAKLEAHDLHKKLSDLFNKVMNPLKAMESVLKAKILDWDRAKQREEDERKRKAEQDRQEAIRKEQARLQAEAKAKADREAKEAADAARKAGESKRAQEQARQKAEADALARTEAENREKIAAMEAAPLPETRPAYERSSSVQTRDNWKAEVTNFQQFVTWVAQDINNRYHLLEPERFIETHPNLNSEAKARKSMLTIPGVRAVNAGSVAAKAS